VAEPFALEVASRCPGCGGEVGPGLLACPSCHRLVHADELGRLAAQAESAESEGRLLDARTHWRAAHDLLPPAVRQSQVVADRIASLNRRLETQPGGDPGETKKPAWAVALGPLGVVLLFALTKGKLLLLGLTKAGTLLSMLAAFGVYWTIWGWPFALGLVASIYVHEMGHVAALRRYGIAASAPMFLPGFGAYVRMKQRPADPVEDARVGLAGPIWGLFTALFCLGLSLVLESPLWAALARTGAWINLFNLLPVAGLDGSRGFAALSAAQRLGVTFVIAAAWGVTRDGLLLLIGAAALFRALVGAREEPADTRTFLEFSVLVASLSALTLIPVATGAP